MKERCVNLRDWESRHLLAHGTLTLVRPVKLLEFAKCSIHANSYRWRVNEHTVMEASACLVPCPFGRTGDTLIGREAWSPVYKQAYASSKSVHARPLFRVDCPEVEVSWRSASTMSANKSRHRMTVESVDVKRCTDVYVSELSGGVPPPYFEVSAAEEWPEKRFPWATSYAWIAKARRQA